MARVKGSTRRLTPHELAIFEERAAVFTSIVMSPITGQHLGHGRSKRVADPTLRHMVALRDHTCRMPGCRVRAEDCELDHVYQWEQHNGWTDYANLMFLCPQHHWQKTAGWYSVQLRPELGDGVVEFTYVQDGKTFLSHPDMPLDRHVWEAFHEPRLRSWADEHLEQAAMGSSPINR